MAKPRAPGAMAQYLRERGIPEDRGPTVNAIDTAAVTRVLEPIWHQKTETASRLRARIEAVLDYAATMRWRSGENPARWRGHLSNIFGPAAAWRAPSTRRLSHSITPRSPGRRSPASSATCGNRVASRRELSIHHPHRV